MRISCRGRGISSFLLFSLIVITSLVSGCAFSPVERPLIDVGQPLQNRYFDLPKTDLMEVCKVTAQNMGYSVIHEDPTSGIIRTGLKQIEIAGNANCGTWNGNQIGGFAGSAMEIKVKSLGDRKSMAEVDARFATRFQGKNLYGMVTRDESYRCASLGQLENQYFSSLTVLAEHWKKVGEKAKTASPSPSPSPTVAAPQKPQSESEAKATAAAPSKESVKDGPQPPSEKLQKLMTLKTMGLLSEAEFEAEKAKLGKTD